jgi:hypothetical protein
MDRNNNGVEDRKEVLFTYFTASIAITLACFAFYVKEYSFAKWSLGFATTLTGGRDVLNKWIK